MTPDSSADAFPSETASTPLRALNWLEGQHDAYTRPLAVELQGAVHRQLVSMFKDAQGANTFLETDRAHWRRLALMKSQLVMGRNFSGTVLEIGAGTGWCSGLLSMVPRVDKVYCSDYDPVSVEVLMPQVHKSLGADVTKIQRVRGSFNDIPMENEVDLIVSMGAIHHSENLYATLRACFKALKPGGWLMASEPAMPDTATNRELQKLYKREIPASMKKFGKSMLQEENSDHFYRIGEFMAAAYAAKFDAYPFLFDLTGNRQADDQVLIQRKTGTGFHPNVLYPYFAKTPSSPMFDSLLLMLQKPEDGGIDLRHVLTGDGRTW